MQKSDINEFVNYGKNENYRDLIKNQDLDEIINLFLHHWSESEYSVSYIFKCQ